MDDPEVAIVGGGPVGMGLAIELGQRGVSVAVFERRATLSPIPKGQNLTQRTGEHFLAWGALDGIRAALPVPTSLGIGGITVYRNLQGAYSYDWLSRADVREFYAIENLRLPQYATEAVLRKRVSQLDSVQVFLGHSVQGIELGPEAARLTVRDTTETIHRVTSPYVVGCDGARSLVRKTAGLPTVVKSHLRRMVLAVFRSTDLDHILSRFPGKAYFNALHPAKEGYWQFFGRVGPDTWFFHTPVHANATTETLDLGAHLSQAAGRNIDFDVESLGFWDLRTEFGTTYREGRAFIAGDAAHSHPPYGGYGVNIGFEDARNLGWKLAAVLKGWGGERLLDSYSAERQPVFESTARDFIDRMIENDRTFVRDFDPDIDRAAFEAEWQRRSQATKQDVSGFCPNYAGSPIVSGGGGSPSAIGAHDHRARPGYLLSPREDLMDRLGDGFTLVTVGGTPTGAFVDAADRIGIPLTVTPMQQTMETRMWNAALILLRPDRYVAYCGSGDARDASAILRRAAGWTMPAQSK